MIGILIGLYLQISIVLLSIILAIICIIIYLIISDIKKCILYLCACIVGIIQIHSLESNYAKISLKIPEEITLQALVISDGTEKDYKYTYTIEVNTINGKRLEKTYS